MHLTFSVFFMILGRHEIKEYDMVQEDTQRIANSIVALKNNIQYFRVSDKMKINFRK